MGVELGRISGPLLSENLLRNGVDLSVETSLLYINVVDGKIGINTEVPDWQLSVVGTTRTTNLIVDNTAEISNGNFFIGSNEIQLYNGPLYLVPNQASNPVIATPRVGVLNLRVSNQLIENITTDSDINLSPSGSGSVVFTTSEVNVDGSIHATGDITWDGVITIGDSNTDSVAFNADVTSNIIPDGNYTRDLGAALKSWDNLYTIDLKGNTILTDSITIGSINPALEPGNAIYVAINGNDASSGLHQHGPVRTIKHALSIAVPGDEIFIYPGTYQEEFPLTIPQGVTVRGAGIRSVLVEPTPATNHNDAFLLNGETAVSFLTVQNFFYDALANTGYAFRFAPGMKVTSRSPYMFNVTVITRGSVTTVEDPLGFDQGDAGGGAYLDGSVVDPTSAQATGLFFATTFITPNQDGIVATNGVRVEWLNSFTYFAKRGIYLLEGTLGFASLGIKYGAEMRSINSANVYGVYGAVADGPHTLGYLIGHNFGYIGTGSNSANDISLVIQGNEVDTKNSGVIYYDSKDHKGDFRIGDIFYVNQETGNVVFDARTVNFGATGSITLEGAGNGTVIDKSAIQTGNIKIHDNNIDSLSGPVNFSAATGKTYLNTNVFVTGNMSITGDGKVSGTVYLGDNPLDTITIYPKLTQDINPDANNTLTLGSSSKRWNTLFAHLLDVDGVTQVSNNTVTTLTAGTDLRLTAAGTGRIRVPSTPVVINNNLTVGQILTVNGLSTLQATNITGTVTLVGNIGQTGNTYVTGLFANNNISIIGASYFEVPDVKLFNNVISATATNNDLVFSGNSTGGVIVDSKIKFLNNAISNVWTGATTNLQKSIVLAPNGTGNAQIASTNALVLPVGNNTTRTLSAVGEVRYNNSTSLFEGWQPSGLISFYNIYDSDRNTYVTAELTPGANDNTIRFGINGTVVSTITSTALFSNSVRIDDINIAGNTINNSVLTNDLELIPSGSGSIIINATPFKDDTITNLTDGALTIASTGTGYVKFTGVGAMVLPIGPSEDRRILPEVGEIRNNTTLGFMEVFDGTAWIPAIGVSGAATNEEVHDIMDMWTLILG